MHGARVVSQQHHVTSVLCYFNVVILFCRGRDMSIFSNLRRFAFSLVYHETSPWDEIHAYQSFKQHAYIIFAAL